MYYKIVFKLLIASSFLNLAACSVLMRDTLLTSISVERGSNCKDIIVQRRVSMDLMAFGPPLLPFIPIYIFDQSSNKKKVVNCITDKEYRIRKVRDAYYWYDAACKYKVDFETDYTYMPFVAAGGAYTGKNDSEVKPIVCYSYSDFQ